MQRVFVQSSTGAHLMPCHPARARRLLRDGRARVLRRTPFTIQLLDREQGAVQSVRLKFDPGAKVTGMALVVAGDRHQRVVWAAELTHRSQQIRKRLNDRRAFRRARRGRNCRNRPARFNNRRRRDGWLPPSVQSRVDNTTAWAQRLIRLTPVSHIDVETTRFDTHALSAGKALSGVEYQQGTLQGTEAREYLLHRHQHACAYCDGRTSDPVLEVEHVHPRSRGGSNRIANLVIACTTCNHMKDNRTAGEWAASITGNGLLATTRRRNAERIDAGQRPSLRDAAAMNATRYAIGRRLQAFGLPVTFASGGRTKFNRSTQGYPKAHWIDAACVGDSGTTVRLDPTHRPLDITACGRGRRQVCRPDRYGFPRTRAGRCKRVDGLQTGDTVRLRQARGKYRGVHIGTLAGIRADGRMDLQSWQGKITASSKQMTRLARFDGYRYGRASAA